MTIKNRGGVFGRNPTFNNVEVEGTLTTTGSLSFPADSISGNAINGGTPTTAGLIVDTTTLVVDAENNRVGVGTAVPTGVLAATDGSNSLIVGQSTDNFHAANAHRFYTLSFGAEPVRIDSDGVKFNGDTAAANALSDYEEGNWTATDASGAGLSLTAYGNYTKIGRTVFWQAYVLYPTTSNGSVAAVGGLPFTLVTGSSVSGRSGSSITAATEATTVQSLQVESSNTVRFYKAGFVQNTNAELSGDEIYFSGFYITA
jgi:hypothetical protein